MKINLSRQAAVVIAVLLSLGASGRTWADAKKPVPKPKPTPSVNPTVRGESTDDEHHKEAIESPSKSPTPKPSLPSKSKSVESHSQSQSIQLHDGANVIQSRDGVKLTAQSDNHSVTRWSATDEAGHKLPTKVQQRSTSSGLEQVITIQDTAHHRELETVVTTENQSARKIHFRPFLITKKIDKASFR